ncbi:MAG: DUF58 domain-containing protein [Desulfobacter sp.]|nr:MAG: DUF58 domain-containing protein [Desulfobacter sp.]
MMEIGRKDLSIRPTQAGLLFLGILIAMLLGSINYNNNAGFILVFLLGTMTAISLFHSYRNLTGLAISPMHVQPVFMGQSLVFSARIKTGRHPDQGQALSLALGKEPPQSFSGQGVLNLPLPASRRGYHRPGPLILVSAYPFGLFRLRAELPFPAKGLVYPAPVSGTFPTAAAGDGDGGDQKAEESGPDDFQGLKPYIPGSPMGRISWKTFSRGRGMFIKNFTADKGSEIVMDLSLIQGTDLEKKLSLVCNGVIQAEKCNIRYGIRLGPTEIRPASGKKHFHRCLKALALYSPGEVSQ